MEGKTNSMDISIVIPVYNNWEFTKVCLETVALGFAQNSEISYEIIVVDNASFDATESQISTLNFSNLQYEKLTQNFGFAIASNKGAEIATGKYLLFLNNDIKIFPNAIEYLYKAIHSASNIGVVGSRLLYPNFTIQHAGLAMDENYDWWHIFRNYPGSHPLVLEKRKMQAITGASMMLRREDFFKVGRFDESYLNSHEDLDLCFKIRRLEKDILYEPDSVMIHYESITDGRYGSNEKNRFVELWKKEARYDYTEKTLVYAEKKFSLYNTSLLDSNLERVYFSKNDALDGSFAKMQTRDLLQITMERLRLEQTIKKQQHEISSLRQEHYLVIMRLGKIILWFPNLLRRLIRWIWKS